MLQLVKISTCDNMKKAGADPKVKKTFVRNCELKVKNHKLTGDLNAGSSKSTVHPVITQELDQPTICSSEALANYLTGAKNVLSERLSDQDMEFDKTLLSAKMTKKLNFHFNDRIYNNLVELNSDIACLKNKKGKKTIVTTTKKDLEPNIDDFCRDEKEDDVRPNIPVIRPIFKPVKEIELGRLHKLVAPFDVL